MSEARRLIEAGNERERALLQAGAEERPSPASVRAAAQALGLLPTAALTAHGILAAIRAVRWSSLAVYVLAPTVGIVSVGATAFYGFEHRTRTASFGHAAPSVVNESSSPWAPPAPADPIAMDSPTNAAEIAAPAVVETPSVPASHGLRAAGRRGGPATGRGASVLAGAGDAAALKQQLVLVDHARALATSGDSAAALRAVDEYDRRFPGGALSEEASLVRIEAVAARGDRDHAAALAERFVAEHPGSVYADRVRAIVRAP
jgi:hypothetical protein